MSQQNGHKTVVSRTRTFHQSLQFKFCFDFNLDIQNGDKRSDVLREQLTKDINFSRLVLSTLVRTIMTIVSTDPLFRDDGIF